MSAAFLISAAGICTYADGALALPVKIDGTDTVFVSSFGKISYAGSSHSAYKTLEEGISALADGGKIVFAGAHSINSETLGSGKLLSFVGTGSKGTGNPIKFNSNTVTALSDLEFDNLAVQFPENGKLIMNGHNFTASESFDTYYTIPDYKTGERKYSAPISVYSGDSDGAYMFDIGGGYYKELAASPSENSVSEIKISGGKFERVVIGSDEGQHAGDINLSVSGGEIGELIIGADGGSMNGKINVEILNGKIGKISVGAYDETASFSGSAVVDIKKGDIGEIASSGKGNISADTIIISNAVLSVAEDAKYTSLLSLDGGTIKPVYGAGGKIISVECFDEYGCAAEKLVSADGKEIPVENGAVALPSGNFSGKIISALNLGIKLDSDFIAGYEDGSFRPDNNMTRAEAITLLTRIIADENVVKSGSFANNFEDVSEDAWYKNYIGFFDAAGLLDKIGADGKIEPMSMITRGEFVQLIYNIENKIKNESVSYAEFAKLIFNVSSNISVIEKFNEFSDVDYTNTYGNAIYHSVANGYVNGYSDGTFAPSGNITRAEVVTVINRMLGRYPVNAGSAVNMFSDIPDSHWALGQISASSGKYGEAWIRSADTGGSADGTAIPEYLKALMKKESSKNSTDLLKSVAAHVYKSASKALASSDISAEQKTALAEAVTFIKNEARGQKTRTIYGSPDEPNGYVYCYTGGPYVRDVTIKSRKPGTDPVEIVQTSDTHFNLVNELDEQEKNPSVMSTKENRKWLAGGQAVTPVRKSLDYAKYADQTVVTGDILDYLSHGCKQLTIENLFRLDTDILACLGGHDITRVMEGTVADSSSYESRIDILREFWPHDVYYKSKVIKDKVMCIALDNGSSKFWDEQIPQLEADIKRARENGYVILIFEHEPLSTRNPDETAVVPLSGDKNDSENFSNAFMGREGSSGATLEVYNLITQNADVVRGVFCGHWHNDYYSEIIASYTDENGNKIDTVIPQYVSTATVYDNVGHVIKITVE